MGFGIKICIYTHAWNEQHFWDTSSPGDVSGLPSFTPFPLKQPGSRISWTSPKIAKIISSSLPHPRWELLFGVIQTQLTLCITFKCVSVCAGDWTQFLTHAKLLLPLNHTSSPQTNLQQTQSCLYWFSSQEYLVVPCFYTANQQTATWHEDPVEYSSLFRSKGSRCAEFSWVLPSPPHACLYINFFSRCLQACLISPPRTTS